MQLRGAQSPWPDCPNRPLLYSPPRRLAPPLHRAGCGGWRHPAGCGHLRDRLLVQPQVSRPGQVRRAGRGEKHSANACTGGERRLGVFSREGVLFGQGVPRGRGTAFSRERWRQRIGGEEKSRRSLQGVGSPPPQPKPTCAELEGLSVQWLFTALHCCPHPRAPPEGVAQMPASVGSSIFPLAPSKEQPPLKSKEGQNSPPLPIPRVGPFEIQYPEHPSPIGSTLLLRAPPPRPFGVLRPALVLAGNGARRPGPGTRLPTATSATSPTRPSSATRSRAFLLRRVCPPRPGARLLPPAVSAWNKWNSI